MDYDTELRLLNEVLRRAYDIDRHDHVLDIGCGAVRPPVQSDLLQHSVQVPAVGDALQLVLAGVFEREA